MQRFRHQHISFFSFCFISCLLAIAYILEHYFDMLPCTLCLLQRYVFYILAIICLLSTLHNPKTIGYQCYGALIILIAILGMGLSGRQVYLQHLPPDLIPSCTASLTKLLQFHPVLDAIKIALQGSSECSETQTLFGLSLAVWSLLAFIACLTLGILLILPEKKGGK